MITVTYVYIRRGSSLNVLRYKICLFPQDGIVRIKLAKLLEKHPNVIYEESEAKNGGVEMVGFFC